MEHVTQEFNDTIDMEHVADSTIEEIMPGKIIHGEIVTFDSDFVYVNVGTKSDGRISIEEFDNDPKVGQVVDVIMKSKRLVDGMYQFSKNEAENVKKWQDFLNSYREGNRNISGKVKSSTNKGKLIDCEGIVAFLPFSLTADLKAISKSDEEYQFKIKSVDIKKRSIVISRKDILDEENQSKWENFTSKYKAGDKIQGEVLKFVEFGVFVKVEGIDALLHRNDMSWKRYLSRGRF